MTNRRFEQLTNARAPGWRRCRAALPALLLGTAFLASALPAMAQEPGRVTGQVTMEGSGAPLGEVQIFLTDTGVGSLTRQNGRYVLLNVPAGSYEIRAERIGLGGMSVQITVAAGATVVQDFTLTEEALGLDEIVVTGTAGAARQREIGNTIAQINVAEIPDRPLLVSDILQSQAPGVEVYGGGGVGQAKIIRLRGASSVELSNHPLIYIDGVRIRSDPLPDANPPDRRGGRSGNIAVSPLDNINPADIERIEVIKGSAATTLYGTEASAGVIQVFTKRGAAGAPVWAAEVKAGSAWSRKFGVDTPGADPYINMGPWLCTGPFSCGQYHPGSPFTLDYSLSVRGGRQDLQYFISGGFLDEQGYMTNDSQKKYHTRANFTITPAADLTIQWNTAYSANALTMTNGQNNAQGITLNAFRAERNYFGTGDPAVLNELMDQQLNQDVERLTTGATITYSPLERLTNRFTVGYDFSSQEHRNLRPYAWRQVPEGSLLNNTFQNRVLSFDYVGTYNFELTSSIGSNFSWGGQATGDDDRLVEGFGENFPGAADPTLESAALTQAHEERSKIWNAGFFFQNVFDISDRYFITVGHARGRQQRLRHGLRPSGVPEGERIVDHLRRVLLAGSGRIQAACGLRPVGARARRLRRGADLDSGGPGRRAGVRAGQRRQRQGRSRGYRGDRGRIRRVVAGRPAHDHAHSLPTGDQGRATRRSTDSVHRLHQQPAHQHRRDPEPGHRVRIGPLCVADGRLGP